MSYVKINGQVPNFIDANGTVVDQFYVRITPFIENGAKKVILNGKKKSVKELMATFQPKEEYTEEVKESEATDSDDGTTIETVTTPAVDPDESEEKKSQSKEELIISLFEGNPDLTYKEVTDIMERQSLKVTSNDIADAKKVWKGEK